MMGWAGERRLCALASHPGAADDASFIAAAPVLIDALAAIERNAKAERGLWRRLVAWVFQWSPRSAMAAELLGPVVLS